MLVDTDNDGLFSDEGVAGVIAGAVSSGGNLYRFNADAVLNNNIRFTFATVNVVTTSLPIELAYFDVTEDSKNVLLRWGTESKKNNDCFEVQRMKSDNKWDTLYRYPGAGNSNLKNNYEAIDS